MSRNHINILTSSVVVLLPGGVGTAGEARLAVRYGRSAVAFLESRDEIPSLPTEIVVRSDFEAVTDFIQQRIDKSVK
jgi:predicted Rossmann-fold nucleotide-binding protein